MAFIRHVLNVLLWPVADCHWQRRIKLRRLRMRLEYVDDLSLSPDGTLILSGNILDPVQLQANGSVRVGKKYLRPRRFDAIPTLDPNTYVNPGKVPWLEWYDNLLIMEMVDHRNQKSHEILTFEHGRWLQWRILTDDVEQPPEKGKKPSKHPSFIHALWVDLNSTRRLGRRFIGRFVSIGWKLVLILWLVAGICAFIVAQYLNMSNKPPRGSQQGPPPVQEDVR